MTIVDQSRRTNTDTTTREADEHERTVRSTDVNPRALALLNELAGTDRYTPRTMKEGLSSFQRSEGLPATGDADGATLRALGRRTSQLPGERVLEQLERDGSVSERSAHRPSVAPAFDLDLARARAHAPVVGVLDDMAQTSRRVDGPTIDLMALAQSPPNKVAALRKNDTYEITGSIELGVGRGGTEEQVSVKVTRGEDGGFKIEAGGELGAAAIKKGGFVEARAQAAAGAKITFQVSTAADAKKLTECVLRYGMAAYNPMLEGAQQLRNHGAMNAADTAFLRSHISDVTVFGVLSAAIDKASGAEGARAAMGAAFQGLPAEKVSSTIHFEGGRATTVEVAVETSGRLSATGAAGLPRASGNREQAAGLPMNGLSVNHQEDVSVKFSTVHALPEHVDSARLLSDPVASLMNLEGQLKSGARTVTLKSERATGVQLGLGVAEQRSNGGGTGAEQFVRTRTLEVTGWNGSNTDLVRATVLVAEADLPGAITVFGPGAQAKSESYSSTETQGGLSLNAEIQGVGLKIKGQTKERHREVSTPSHGALELLARPIHA